VRIAIKKKAVYIYEIKIYIMKKSIFFLAFFFLTKLAIAQNVGIGVAAPAEKLEVNGTVKATALAVTQGSQYDIVKKGTGNQLLLSKGNKGVGLNYIIAIAGIFPGFSGSPNYSNIFIGEIRLFAGNYAPAGFAFCQGQLLPINANETLFAIIGTLYGGNGISNFALPDLRGAVPVGIGTPVNGAGWIQGEVN
jgi:microcystin-dependent protein